MWIHCLKWNGEGRRKDRQPNRKTSALINATKAISGFAVPNECSAGGLIEAQQWALLSARHARHPYRSFPSHSEDLLLRPIKTLCSGTTELLFLWSSRYRRLSPKSFGGKEIKGKTMTVVCTACTKQAPRNFDRLIVWYGNGLWWVYDGDPSASCPRDILTSVYVAGDATWPLPHFKNIFTIAVQEYMSSRLKGNSLLALSQWMSNLWMWLFSIFPSPEAHSGGRILITTNTIWYGKSNFFFLVKTIFTSGNAMSPFEYQ